MLEKMVEIPQIYRRSLLFSMPALDPHWLTPILRYYRLGSAEFVEFRLAPSHSLCKVCSANFPVESHKWKILNLKISSREWAVFEEDKLLKINFPINWSKRRSFCHWKMFFLIQNANRPSKRQLAVGGSVQIRNFGNSNSAPLNCETPYGSSSAHILKMWRSPHRPALWARLSYAKFYSQQKFTAFSKAKLLEPNGFLGC